MNKKKKFESLEHPVLPDGHSFKLNFDDRTKTGFSTCYLFKIDRKNILIKIQFFIELFSM